MSEQTYLSILVPAYNEEQNIQPLVDEIKGLVASVDWRGELVIIDDGSTDNTLQEARRMAEEYDFIITCSNKRNKGKTAAIEKGIKCSTGEIMVIFDADLQYSSEDIPKMLAKLDEGYDIITGWKQGDYQKPVVSTIYNFMCRRLFPLKVHDLNSIKLFRREVVQDMLFRKGWHRYLAVIAANKGFKVDEVKVELRPRLYGEAKYSSPFRIFIGLFDLLSVKFQLSFFKKPMLLFGSLGMILFALAFIVAGYAILRRILYHGYRPLLYLIILLAQMGISFFVLGFLAEAISELRARLERTTEELKNKIDDLKK